MNYQRCHPPLVSLYRPILRTKSLVIFLLVSLLNVSSYPLYAEQHAQSEENSVKELIDKVGKPKLTLFIRKLRQNHITVDVNGTLRDFSGSPDLTYITPRSLLHDIHQVGLSVEQAAAAYRRADKMAKERKLKARIEAEKANAERRLEARTEWERIKQRKNRAVNSKDEAISWFEKQPLIVRIERSEGYDWAMIIYLKQSWYSLNMRRKKYIINKWVDVWKRVGGKYITFRIASNDDPVATFHSNSVKVLK